MTGTDRKKILLVDDEPNFVEAFRMTLQNRDYEIIAVSNLEQVQRVMRHEDLHLIVLGTVPPAGQAFSIYQWIRQHPLYRKIPLLVVDARPEERPTRGWRREEGLQLEADDYVSKPVEPAALVPRIQELLSEVFSKISVLVVDDHTMVRDGITAVLSLQKEVELVGEAVNGQDALDKVERFMPNVVLMDIVMPVLSGLEATKQISKVHPNCKVLILTQYDEEENMLVAKHAGAYGFIPKKAASSELLNGIRSVFQGNYFPSTFIEIGSEKSSSEKVEEKA